MSDIEAEIEAATRRARSAAYCCWPSLQRGGRAEGMRDLTQQAERLMAIRLRYTINTHLEDQGIRTPAAVGAAVGLPAAEAAGLLTRRQWRAGDVAALQALAERLGLEVVPPDTDLLRGKV